MNLFTHLAKIIQPHLVIILLACIGLLRQVQAVSPAPDGCYAAFTTAKRCDALNFLTIGAGNTTLGWRSLFLNSPRSFNTAVGDGALALNKANSNTAVDAAALLLNTTGIENTAIGTDALVFNDSGRTIRRSALLRSLITSTGSATTLLAIRRFLKCSRHCKHCHW